MSVLRRVIPVVLCRDGRAMQSKRFRRHQALGDPSTIVRRLSGYAADELIYLDISHEPDEDRTIGVLREVADGSFMPLTFGGRVRTCADIERRIRGGADKVALTSAPLENPGLLGEAARAFGSQCVVLGIDARTTSTGWEAMAGRGRDATGRDVVEWAREGAERGAGEILLQSVDRDGSGLGYDLELVRAVADAVRVPVVALGGAGSWEDLHAGLVAGASGAAAANIFNHTEHSVVKAKRRLLELGADVRRVGFTSATAVGQVMGGAA